MNNAAIHIVRTLRDQGHQAYLVGGCVRDLLLGREPADYDVATSAKPDEVMRIFPRTVAVGAQFGVVLVEMEDGVNIEVATFRSDLGYSDGRHPDAVRYSQTSQEDVQRRDFTINGLLMDPISNEVLDFVGGQADLKAGIVRTIGEPKLRFGEDKLRMLRAVRFTARFGYQIEAATLAAIRGLAADVHDVSQERIRDELTKMLTEGRARQAFELLDMTGLLTHVLPEIAKMKGVEQPPQFHPEGDVWIHTLMLLEGLSAGCSPTLAWGALLHDVGKPPTFRRAPDRIRFDEHDKIGTRMAEAICSRLRMSNEDTEQITALVAHHMKFAHVRQMRPSTLKKFVRMPGFNEHLEQHRLDCLASHRQLDLYEFVQQKLAELPEEQLRPRPLLSGDDLIAAGYKPGPRFSEILTAVEDAQLDGALTDKNAALAYVQSNYPLV